MDIDAFVAAHSPAWRRLEQLVSRARRPRRLSGAELDEMVDLYQRTATHLSVVRTSSPDPQLVARLSTLVARSRSAVAGARNPAWRDAARFAVVTFPAAVYRMRWWVLGTAVGFLAVAFGVGIWVASSPAVQASVGTPESIRQLVETDFENYYSAEPASAFAGKVFVNNVFVAARAFAVGIVFCLLTVQVLLTNAASVGVVGGIMAANGRAGLFFGLITPHGLLELTAIFIAAAAGMRLGWRVVDPGPRRRVDALAAEGRAAAAVVLGLVAVFLVAGLTEAFVTPSGLPTWARVGIGVVLEAAFVAGMCVLGRRAVVAGETGDLADDLRGDSILVS
ncbi:MAG TPA: stage II sporulation protein M [Mycobacteriales bacterium]|nr:stage II sporulation protein M [Mycobacteriales bacterium]